MRVARVDLSRYRGVRHGSVLLPKHGVVIGDNNTGKTTLLEALDLVLGPDRLSRRPPIDEHDFYEGVYLDAAQDTEGARGEADPAPGPRIEIEATLVDLNEEQLRHFGDNVEFWDTESNCLVEPRQPSDVDEEQITEALRVTFHGWYDPEEDDFEGRTFFTRSLTEADRPAQFSRKDKLACGFLYLRSLRTGSRALSLERGSLLDIILRLKEARPRMWEHTLGQLSEVSIASDDEEGLSPILRSIEAALKKYVPTEWGTAPRLMMSSLTRDHLRKVVTAFIATGQSQHAAPFYRQGTGTINMLILAMLSEIAELRQNVIFAMEEPETAIPPYAQKRIVHELRQLASQTVFTSHSPYVLEEFSLDETVVLSRDHGGCLKRRSISLPSNVKPKRYQQEFRTRFCEGLLARRVLLAEGATEASAFPVACRRLAELQPSLYSSLEALGICVLDAGSDGNISGMARLYGNLGKTIFALCDRQDPDQEATMKAEVALLLMHEEKGFEDLVLKGTSQEALARFAATLAWPQQVLDVFPEPDEDLHGALRKYFSGNKGSSAMSDFLAQCAESEIPLWIKEACASLRSACPPPPQPDVHYANGTGATTTDSECS